jgi:HSP20 family protein
MDMKTLMPWSRDRTLPGQRLEALGSPFLALHREMNRLFDDFFRGTDLPVSLHSGWMTGWPNVEVSDTGKEIKVIAEVPGLEEKDLEITLHDDVLTLKGEKKGGSDSPVYSEQWHGHFQRSLQLGTEVDPDRVTAEFENGVLTVTLTKRPEAQSHSKRIPISS